MRYLVALVLYGTFLCLQGVRDGGGVLAQPQLVAVDGNGSEFNEFDIEHFMLKLEQLDLRMMRFELTIQKKVDTVSSVLQNLVHVIENLAWHISETERSANSAEHQLKVIAKNLTLLHKEMRDLAIAQQRLPTRTYFDDAMMMIKASSNCENAGDLMQLEHMQISMMTTEKPPAVLEACDQLPASSASGVWTVMPDGEFSKSMKVVCEQEYSGGGWTVFQHRYNGTVNFFRDWDEYRFGFGKMDGGEFWLGLERLHQLTYSAPHELVILLEDFEGNGTYARYENFEIAGEPDLYKVTKINGYNGTAGDSMSFTLGAYFSTFDEDNDTHEENCAVKYHGAWWYRNCHSSNLNGKYLKGKNDEYGRGMSWAKFHGVGYSLKSSKMMIRRKNVPRKDMMDGMKDMQETLARL
ncbi:microfibril-associated glycoprotein 4-like [Culex pipiens pallens]|uniref:microfibril-associated glycoprotein 4-like n=1 Tax=Culex pipiens pallens TaxID=42434 RepID=UPI001953767E|nr:microfibril-associated glycoprotein 4-like [Culex pipiens pallens]